MTRQIPSIARDRYDLDRVHSVQLGRAGTPVPLRGEAGPSGLQFNFRLQYRLVDDSSDTRRPAWRTHTAAYEYRLLDHHERELLVYHWQPGPAFPGPDHPHLHVSAGVDARVSATASRTIPLDKLHLVTERVLLAAVVRMLIEEFRVRPLRADWRERLTRAGTVLRASFLDMEP